MVSVDPDADEGATLVAEGDVIDTTPDVDRAGIMSGLWLDFDG